MAAAQAGLIAGPTLRGPFGGCSVIVVGWGNPGSEYRETRHNIGFRVVEAARERWRGPRWRRRELYRETTIRLGQAIHLLIEPLTYMNCSGDAVAALRPSGVPAADLLVVLDDIDLPFGRLRIREQGGAGGHRGLGSILDVLGSPAVGRMRVGVGRPPQSAAAVEHVLAPFSPAELLLLDAVVARALEALETILRAGLTTAMNRFNRMPAPGELPESPAAAEGCTESRSGPIESSEGGSQRGESR